ncbi:hypothetical protein KUTeg_005551 [Tegillarca granosa]|uniref:Ubiquitin-like protease family profile domain-containing protein n=1 Tax=Tegillarca granosa TaxID=220873 RepID=A0ABQ9FK02_TEGGR|nr:hypothetical protein KUTeg_005551 [Tegillarca granosa]
MLIKFIGVNWLSFVLFTIVTIELCDVYSSYHCKCSDLPRYGAEIYKGRYGDQAKHLMHSQSYTEEVYQRSKTEINRSESSPAIRRNSNQDDWLGDELIDSSMKLIKQQHPHIEGLIDSCVCEVGQVSTYNKPYIQILNEEGQHWIIVTTINCSPGVVKIYDSRTRKVTKRIKLIIQRMTKHVDNKIVLEMPEFQKQRNKADCGLFSIAAMVSLAEGRNPSHEIWDQTKMGTHLSLCLSKGKLTAFPPYNDSNKIKVHVLKKVIFNLHLCSHCENLIDDDSGRCGQCNRQHMSLHLCKTFSRTNPTHAKN